MKRISLALLLSLSVAGCGGATSIEDIDPLTLPVYPGTTWYRATGSGVDAETEILIIEADAPASWSSDARRITRMGVAPDGSVDILLGVIVPDGEGSGEVRFSEHWNYTLEPAVPVLSRRGAFQETLEMAAVESIAFAGGASSLTVTIGGSAATYTNLIDSMGAFDASTGFASQAGAEAAANLVILPMVTSNARIAGFGASGLTQFFGSPAAFPSLVRNGLDGNEVVFSLEEPLMPVQGFDYVNHEDQDGVRVHGDMSFTVDAFGSGDVLGEVAFVFQTSRDDPSQVVEGTLDFTGMMITDGFLSGGTSTVTIDGTSYTVDGSNLVDLDIGGHLGAP